MRPETFSGCEFPQRGGGACDLTYPIVMAVTLNAMTWDVAVSALCASCRQYLESKRKAP